MPPVSGKKRIAIFGSTGSIGVQALDVIRAHADLFSAEVLTAQQNDELLVRQALEFQPNVVVIGEDKKYLKVKILLTFKDNFKNDMSIIIVGLYGRSMYIKNRFGNC